MHRHTTPAPAATLRRSLPALISALALAGALAPAVAAWEPTQPVELVVPAGTGGGADQMARFIQKAVADHKSMGQPLSVVTSRATRASRACCT